MDPKKSPDLLSLCEAVEKGWILEAYLIGGKKLSVIAQTVVNMDLES